MCKQSDQIESDFQRFQATGELPAAWEPEPYRCGYCFECEEGQPCSVVPSAMELARHQSEFDARVDEMNRELEEIESGSVEAPRFGWVNQIGRRA